MRFSGRRFLHLAPLLGAAALAMAPAGAVAGDRLSNVITRERVMGALPKLDEMAGKLVAEGAVPGLAIAVVHADEVVYLKGFGLRAIGKPETVDPDTVFQIASLSKPVSSTVVAALVSDGVVSWDSKIADLDPAFRLADPYPSAELTIRDLFNHRSGLPGTAGDDLEAIGYDRVAILERLRFAKPWSSFRAGYSYSNFGLTEGGVAAARATGKSWEDIAEEKLYRPLGMGSTSSRHGDFLKRTNRSALHVKVDGAWAAKLERNPDAQAPAGGVSSSARDLAEWMRLELANGSHAGKPLIAPEAIAETHMPLMARGLNPLTGATSFYGLGWNVEIGRHGVTWGHAGAFSVGARTLVTLHPKEHLGIVVLTNAFPTGVPEGISDNFADELYDGKAVSDWVKPWNQVYESLFGPAVAAAKAAFAESPSPATAAAPDAAYLGRYFNDFAGDAVVSGEAGELTLQLGPGGRSTYPLTHFDRDIFLAYPDPELPETPSPVTFLLGADGRASAVTIGFLDDNGLGTLQRGE